MNWQGLRVLNTRPLHQNQSLNVRIQKAGGVPIVCPLLEILPVGSTSTWIKSLKVANLAIFTSQNAVRYFCDSPLLSQWPKALRVIAIGHATALALTHLGIHVDAVPTNMTSEGLLALSIIQNVAGQSILIIKGEEGRKLLAETLSRRGAHVFSICVYRRALPKLNKESLHALWHEDALDVIVITSETSLRHLFSLFDARAHAWLQSKVFLVKSERIAVLCRQYGIKKWILESEEYF